MKGYGEKAINEKKPLMKKLLTGKNLTIKTTREINQFPKTASALLCWPKHRDTNRDWITAW
jgi:hypothetical protein